jgi:hypothetical protein
VKVEMKNSSTHNRVMEFIALLKGHKNKNGQDAHEQIESMFLMGNCYMFARTLKFVFPRGKILYRAFPSHAVFKISGRIYDIRGDITRSYSEHYFRPITEEDEKNARTFCYSGIMNGPVGLQDGERFIEEDDFLQRLGIEKNTKIAEVVGQ